MYFIIHTVPPTPVFYKDNLKIDEPGHQQAINIIESNNEMQNP